MVGKVSFEATAEACVGGERDLSVGKVTGGNGTLVKTGGGAHGEEARTYIFENLFWGPGCGFSARELLQAELRGNVFCGNQAIRGLKCSPGSSSVSNRVEAVIGEADLPVDLPVRPVGFTLDRVRFSDIRMRKGEVVPGTLSDRKGH